MREDEAHPSENGDPHSVPTRGQWRPAALQPLATASGGHQESSQPRSWDSGWDQGLGHRPCCAELKMVPWELAGRAREGMSGRLRGRGPPGTERQGHTQEHGT